ncbi:MAG: hypothetical protein KJ072_05385 [Verrucomicrobia bacterium]|nr:hypothetical protein [Verrucomicrobiota bacterium]
MTQIPLAVRDDFRPTDLLDDRYPPGSRVALVQPGSTPSRTRVLSPAFHAAGGPVIGPEGDRVLFVGKRTAASTWQIYESPLTRGVPTAQTALPQGAMDPVYLTDGRFAFSSPVPKTGQAAAGRDLPELYAQQPGDRQPTRLTFGLAGATESTILGDGRILFVSGGSPQVPVTNLALFTINTDGTELSAFAAQHDGQARIRRPRETADGRVLFLSSALESTSTDGQLEHIFTARPFSSRAAIPGTAGMHIRAAEPASADQVWVTMPGQGTEATYGVYVWSPQTTNQASSTLIFDDPQWHEVEVAARRPGPKPMGRLSTVNENMPTGLLLCLDANYTGTTSSQEGMAATRVRFLRPSPEGALEWLGEIPLQADGSFLAEVPANTLLGLETLDDAGQVVSRLPPAFWVRPGENRSCVGCHEPHSTCPENRRPLAVRHPPARLELIQQGLAQQPSPSPAQ